MSYSRWNTSRWYTYWQCCDSKIRNDQVFKICIDGQFTYKQLKEDKLGCLETIVNNEDIGVKPTQAELDELETYMDYFIKDVEDDEILE